MTRQFECCSSLGPIGAIRKALNRCGKRVEDAARKVEALADHVWNHRKYNPINATFVSFFYLVVQSVMKIIISISEMTTYCDSLNPFEVSDHLYFTYNLS